MTDVFPGRRAERRQNVSKPCHLVFPSALGGFSRRTAVLKRSRGEVLEAGYLFVPTIDAARVELRAAAGVRDIDRLLHDGHGFAGIARDLEAQGSYPPCDGKKPMVSGPVGSLKHVARLSRPLLRRALSNEDFRARERQWLEQRMLVALARHVAAPELRGRRYAAGLERRDGEVVIGQSARPIVR